MLGAEQEIKQAYVAGGQVKLRLGPMLDHGDRSLQTHQAAECAAEQGQFWALHDLLFEEQSQLYRGEVRQVIKELAAGLPLDRAAFETCIDEQRYAPKVQEQDEARRALGIRQRPTVSVNGQLVFGPQPFSAYQQLIEAELGN